MERVRAAPSRSPKQGESMKPIALALPLAVALAGCNSKPTVEAKNASVAEVAKQVQQSGAAVKMKPGKWAMTAIVENVEIPGMPKEMAASFSNTSKKSTFESCLTPEQADRPSGDFFGGAKNGNCTYEHFSMDGGKIDAKANCSVGQMKQTIVMNGEFGAEHFKLRQTVETDPPPGTTGKMKATVSIDSKRVGECTAKTS
jgi:hypothetical protein